MAKENPVEALANLDQMSTPALEALVRSHMENPENQNDEMMFHILEVLNERAKEEQTGAVFDKERVWQIIQERQGQSHRPRETAISDPKPRAKARPKWIRGLSAAAAVLIVVWMGNMVGVQAGGTDIFGLLARWTADIFQYTGENQTYTAVRDAFAQNHFPLDLAPAWYPDGFVPGDEKLIESAEYTSLTSPLDSSDKDAFFFIEVRRYASPADLDAFSHQWDPKAPQTYTSADKTFLIVSNLDRTTALWSDEEEYSLAISGDLSVGEIKKIIDSIGG